MKPQEDKLSPWWLRTVLLVMVFGFVVLLLITRLAYQNAPPIPNETVAPDGKVLFTGDDVRAGQAIFLKYGLMDNGTIWGHGAYLGPDFSANALNRMGQQVRDMIAQLEYQKSWNDLEVLQQAGVRAKATVMLKTNRYDEASGKLQLTYGQAKAFAQEPNIWRDYFADTVRNGGLKPGLISDADELKRFSAFVTWAAWASVANRPGANYSYTNNFPFDPDVGNVAPSGALLWSALSLIVLLGGTALVLLAFGTFDSLGWISRGHRAIPRIRPGESSPGQRALAKFFVVVALLYLMQTFVGGGVAHYRADPGSFYGFQLQTIFPSNLLRTWHLQTAILWIATAYVAAALYLGRSLRNDEPRWLPLAVHLLFAAFFIVIAGSLLGEWLGLSQVLGRWWFWLGSQGWEYLEIGRIWQFLLIVGLLAWFALLWWLARPSTVKQPDAKPLARLFLLAALSIPVFYIPAVFIGAKTNFTVVDTWRFWIVHLWLEGFFEYFATTVVAVVLYQLGLTRLTTALRVIYLDAILYFLGGVIGTGHHWYFSGQTQFNMAMSALFSALEVVPLTLLTLDAWDFVRTTNAERDERGGVVTFPHRWTFYFLMAVGFWNFLGAGVFGFLINMPIVSYYEAGTQLTPNHGHAALTGVFGMLAVGLLVFVLRQSTDDARWPGIEKYIRVSFGGINIGLAMMIVMSLFPSGLMQVWDVMEHGYWHARGFEYLSSPRSRMIEWMRLPGDLTMIIFGAIPLAIASIKGWLAARTAPHTIPGGVFNAGDEGQQTVRIPG